RTLRPIPMMSPAAEDGLVLTAQETEVQKIE
ncbi:winged helix-turn-helix transcriptional regulator, partial [Klebsiella michiganensis]